MGKLVQMMDPRDDQKVYPYPGFPIGAIYMSMNNTNPSTYFGGTWSLIAPGRVLVGVDTSQTEFNTVRKTGGSKYMQTHVHKMTLYDSTQNQSESRDLILAQIPAWNNHWREAGYTVGNALTGIGGQNVQTDNQGNLQPFLTCYIWERTA